MKNENQLSPIDQNNNSVISVEQSRAMQEVQGAIVMAKKYPRDETAAYGKIIQACKRLGLAEKAMYTYPKGGQQITGPSIRLAETLAKYWGNMQFGIVELSQELGSSDVMAYAWDLESNTRQVKQFSVKHSRYTKKSGNVKLTDPRDIYEMTANQGARRVRACILGVVPSDLIDEAIEECEKTLRGDNKEPLIDRIRKCVSLFGGMGVTQEMIEQKLGHKIGATNVYELVNLGKIGNSIKDGMSSIADNFTMPEGNYYQKQLKELTGERGGETTKKSSVVDVTQKIQSQEELEKQNNLQDTFFNLVKKTLKDESLPLKDRQAFWKDKEKEIKKLPKHEQQELEVLLEF